MVGFIVVSWVVVVSWWFCFLRVWVSVERIVFFGRLVRVRSIVFIEK